MLPIHHSRLSVFNYDELPAGYYYEAMLKGSPVQRFWHREKFRAITAQIQDGERVLDLGCGPGSFLSILAEEKPRCEGVGADIASPQIAFATQEIGSRFQGGRIKFVTLDSGSYRLPFPDASFDVVTSIEVIEHLHPYIALQILQEARRVLKKDGRLIVSTPNYRSLWPLLELVLEYVSPVKYHEQHISKFTPNSLVKFMEVLGFEVTSIRTIFMLAPFTAVLSGRLARLLHAGELRLGRKFMLGSLLFAEAKVMDFPQ